MFVNQALLLYGSNVHNRIFLHFFAHFAIYPLSFLSINGTTKHGDKEKEAQTTKETTKNKKS